MEEKVRDGISWKMMSLILFKQTRRQAIKIVFILLFLNNSLLLKHLTQLDKDLLLPGAREMGKKRDVSHTVF